MLRQEVLQTAMGKTVLRHMFVADCTFYMLGLYMCDMMKDGPSACELVLKAVWKRAVIWST